jgi:hypothetical protein
MPTSRWRDSSKERTRSTGVGVLTQHADGGRPDCLAADVLELPHRPSIHDPAYQSRGPATSDRGLLNARLDAGKKGLNPH